MRKTVRIRRKMDSNMFTPLGLTTTPWGGLGGFPTKVSRALIMTPASASEFVRWPSKAVGMNVCLCDGPACVPSIVPPLACYGESCHCLLASSVQAQFVDCRVACPRFQQEYALRHCLQASSGTDRKLLRGRRPGKAIVRFAATVISPLAVIASAGVMIKAQLQPSKTIHFARPTQTNSKA